MHAGSSVHCAKFLRTTLLALPSQHQQLLIPLKLIAASHITHSGRWFYLEHMGDQTQRHTGCVPNCAIMQINQGLVHAVAHVYTYGMRRPMRAACDQHGQVSNATYHNEQASNIRTGIGWRSTARTISWHATVERHILAWLALLLIS